MLKQRVITAIALATAFVAAHFGLSDLGWALFVLMFILVGAWEWAGLAGFSALGRRMFVVATALMATAMLPEVSMQAHFLGTDYLPLVATFFWLAVAPLWLMRRWRCKPPALMALLGWLLLLSAWISLIDMSRTVMLWVIVVVALADSAAYFSGKRFGKHKLAPEISPGKTWEGLAGALAAVTLLALAMHLLLKEPLTILPAVWLLTVFSVQGDLFESLLKRQAGKKDSGTLLPGHGGVLDRIDGLIPTLPLAASFNKLVYYFSLLIS